MGSKEQGVTNHKQDADRKRFLVSDLPHQEVRDHIKRGGLAVLVTGSTECHGAHLPQGTDTFIAQAIAIEIARACDGLLFPPVWFTYSGGTRSYPGTVSIPGDVQYQYTRAVLRSLIANGYEHIVHVQWHGPYYVNQQLTREIFEETGIPVVFFGLMGLPVMQSEEVRRLIGNDWFTGETTIAAGALSMLGLSHLLRSGGFAGDEQPVARPEDPFLRAITGTGAVVGHFFTHPTQHLAVRSRVDEAAGRRVILLLAKVVIDVVGPLKEYRSILRAEWNRREGIEEIMRSRW